MCSCQGVGRRLWLRPEIRDWKVITSSASILRIRLVQLGGDWYNGA